MDILSLPVLIIENIMSFLPYDEIAKARTVCRDLDAVCQRLLNRGFVQIERRHALSLRSVKARLPRRESERRLHQLSRHCDILSAIETRISMLNMTYSKFIEHKICCFIPGKVLDEIKRVLDIVEREEAPPRAHEVLQELRDISSMAIEHFDERVSPALRRRLQAAAAGAHDRPPHGNNNAVDLASVGQLSSLCTLQHRSAMNARLALLLSKQCTGINKKMMIYRRAALRERATVRALTAKVNEQGAAIADLKKRIDECDIKYTELTHTNQAVGGKAIAPTARGESAASTAGATQPLRNFSSQIKLDLSHLPIGTGKRGKGTPNIKPRKPVIRLPSISEDDDEPKAKQPKLDADQSPQQPSTSQATSRQQKHKSPGDRLKKLERELAKDIAPKKKESNLALLGKRKIFACLEQSMDLRSKVPKMD